MASIRMRNGTYQITVSCGYDVKGKKLLETTTFTPDPAMSPKKQEKAAKEFAVLFEQRVKNGLAMDGRKLTLEEFANRWLSEYAEINLQPGTVCKYREELRDKILPALGHLKLTEIRPHTLNTFYLSMRKDGARKDGKSGGYSRASIYKTHNVLSSILRTAVEWELIERNPCNNVKPAAAPDTADNIKFFTPEQTVSFLHYIEQPYTWEVKGHQRTDDTGIPYMVGTYINQKRVSRQLQVLFSLAIYSGMRKGEILALKWPDIDFTTDTVSITKAVTMVAGKPFIKAPKTKSSYRTVTIPNTLTVQLEQLRESQEEYRRKVGDYWKGEDFLFVQEDGRMMNYSTPYHALQTIIAQYNADHDPEDQLPRIPFHGLRHTSATLLISEGHQDPRTVANRLGHAQTSTTLNIYTHALREGDRRAASALENILDPKK